MYPTHAQECQCIECRLDIELDASYETDYPWDENEKPADYA